MYEPKPKTEQKMIITKEDIMHGPTGHKQRASGCGIHQDKRDRRNRTRYAQTQKAIKE